VVVLAHKLRTLDPTQPEASGVAPRDGVIIVVGTHREVLDLAGSKTRVIDGPDLVVTPGLVSEALRQAEITGRWSSPTIRRSWSTLVGY
jgi:hypothetical protein